MQNLTGEAVKIDGIDREIINLILDNSKLSFRQIAQKIGVSVTTVMNRIRAMEKEGVIKKYSAQIDYEKLGYEFDVIIEVQVSHGKLHDIEKHFAEQPNVVAVYDATGQFDITLICRFKSRRQLDSFVKRIQTFNHVERTLTKLILKTIKEEPIKV